jgi:hypothetical protein
MPGRTNAATKQLVGDLRRSHASAINQHTGWWVLFVLSRTNQEVGPDY